VLTADVSASRFHGRTVHYLFLSVSVLLYILFFLCCFCGFLLENCLNRCQIFGWFGFSKPNLNQFSVFQTPTTMLVMSHVCGIENLWVTWGSINVGLDSLASIQCCYVYIVVYQNTPLLESHSQVYCSKHLGSFLLVVTNSV